MALTKKLTAIGDAIREQNGTTDLIPLADMPQAILDIVNGGGTNYKNIIFKPDNTITLTDTDGATHIMSYTYDGGKLVSVSYDGKPIKLTYYSSESDILTQVGKTAVFMANAQISGYETVNHTVTFIVDDQPYEIVSVKSGNSVTPPKDANGLDRVIESTEGNFDFWHIDGERVEFPYVPTSDVEIVAYTSNTRDYLVWKPGEAMPHFGSKSTEEFAISGWCYDSVYYVMAVAKTESALNCAFYSRYSHSTFDYNGETWYLLSTESNNTSVVTSYTTKRIPNCEGLSMVDAAKKMLDYYYFKVNE